jgi:hypothetical protein
VTGTCWEGQLTERVPVAVWYPDAVIMNEYAPFGSTRVTADSTERCLPGLSAPHGQQARVKLR